MQTNYNLNTNALFYDVTLSEEARVVSSCGSAKNELEMFSFQEERVQSAVQGIWCVTAEGKTSCISEYHTEDLLLISSHSSTFNRALRELARPFLC